MRITGGKLASRTLRAPDGLKTRPTTDKVRQALFNIIQHRDWGEGYGEVLTDAVVCDAFCGTGALAYESFSHGATRAFLFDTDRNAMVCAKANAEHLGLAQNCVFYPFDVMRAPEATTPCTLIFLDPPYKKDLIVPTLEMLKAKGWIAPRALIVAETAKSEEIVWPDFLLPALDRVYGDTKVQFLLPR